MSYVNTAIISALPDGEERKTLQQLDIDLFISAEADEQWSFVGHKGDQRWLWYIIEKTYNTVVAFCFGRRKDETYSKLTGLLPQGLVDVLHTDNRAAYKQVAFAPFHIVGKSNTWQIGRKNLDLRNRVKGLARRTICYSKNPVEHDAFIGTFINKYFFKQ